MRTLLTILIHSVAVVAVLVLDVALGFAVYAVVVAEFWSRGGPPVEVWQKWSVALLFGAFILAQIATVWIDLRSRLPSTSRQTRT